ncbi:MAG: gliding motility protein GldM [Chitinophagales bacterium]|nr:gliding motility protein GldM [Chitinophagales bacterium]
MAIPKENRQQMINMMYLVLTALLALNVSAEILNAFKTINKSLSNSNEIAQQNINTTYNAFALKKAKEPANASIPKYEALAGQAMKDVEGLLAYIKNLKQYIVDNSGGPDPDDPLGIMQRKDDMDISTGYLVEGTSGKNGEGYTLKKKIDETLAKLMAYVDEPQKELVGSQIALSTKATDGNKDWVREQFYQMPAIASYSMLTKIENDVKNSENLILSYLFSKIGQSEELMPDEIVFNNFSAQIASPSKYVLEGEAFEADVFLAATSSNKEGTVSINVNGSNLPVNQDGVAHYTSRAGVGEHTVNATVSVKNQKTGQVTSYKTEPLKYTVAKPFATVSPDKMNVFYIGVDNPITVSAAGIAAGSLQVGMSSGNVSGSGGKYSVRVSQQGTTNVTVSASGKTYGTFPFRVKMIPDPIAKVAGKPGGQINPAVLKAQNGVLADLENFDFDAKFEVISYNVFYQPKLQDPAVLSNNGPVFNGATQAAINKAKPGDIYYFEEIKVRGPDGVTRKIPGIAFKIN